VDWCITVHAVALPTPDSSLVNKSDKLLPEIHNSSTDHCVRSLLFPRQRYALLSSADLVNPAKEVHFCLCLSVGRIIKRLCTNIDDIFGEAGYANSDRQLDFGVDQDHSVDSGIF